MIAYPTGSGPDVVTVDAGAMKDLTERYTEYRQTVDAAFFDPVRAFILTGRILASVREITTTGQAASTADTTQKDRPVK